MGHRVPRRVLPFRVVLVAAFAAAVPASACAPTADQDAAASEGAASKAALEPLDDGDFTATISKDFLQQTHALPPAVFETKWKASRSDSALMFFRAYPGGYHKDFAANLKGSARSKIPAGTGLCFGDPHPDNFGFLKFDSNVLYGFNDLDDSGTCPVALDALRYVTAVSLYFGDKDLVESVAKRYVEVLTGSVKDTDVVKDWRKLRDDHAPNFGDRRADKLDELMKGDALLLGENLSSPTAAERTAITDIVTRTQPGTTVLDVATVQRDGGGSGGLARYWALVSHGSSRTLLELKEAAKPGVDFGIDARPVAFNARLADLKQQFWGVSSEKDYVYVTTLGKTFLVRDRLAKASLALEDLKKKDLEDVLQTQAEILGLLHKRTLHVSSDQEGKALRGWLEDSSKVVASRWKKAFK